MYSALIPRNSQARLLVASVAFCCVSVISFVTFGYKYLPWLAKKDKIKKKKNGTINIGGKRFCSIILILG